MSQSFYCESCNYITTKHSDYKKHTITKKHIDRTNIEQNISLDVIPNQKRYICHCGKEYSARNSLWYHKKTCQQVTNNQSQPNETNELLKTLISTLQETNQTLSKLSK